MASVRHLGLFPQCVPLNNPIFDPTYQWAAEIFECDLFTAIAFFWKIKKIKLNLVTTFSYEALDLSGNTYIYSNTKSSDFIYSIEGANSEKDLVCNSFSWSVQSQDPNNEIIGPAEGFNFSPQWKNGEKYYIGSIAIGVTVRDAPDAPLGRIGVSLTFGLPELNNPYWDSASTNNITFSREDIVLNSTTKVKTNVIKEEEKTLWYSNIDSWQMSILEHWPYDS